jgi:integrase/recombinase XerD
LTTSRVRQIVKEAANKAGILKFYPHLLRHHCGTHLAELGYSDDFISKFLGHEDPKTTRRYYLHNDR